MIKNNNYSAKDIEILEGLEPVRKRPGMYIGGTDETAFHHLATEIIDNSMDEVTAGHAKNIYVKLNKDQKIFAPMVKVRSLRCVALSEIPKNTIMWNQKKAYPPINHPSASVLT